MNTGTTHEVTINKKLPNFSIEFGHSVKIMLFIEERCSSCGHSPLHTKNEIEINNDIPIGKNITTYPPLAAEGIVKRKINISSAMLTPGYFRPT